MVFTMVELDVVDEYLGKFNEFTKQQKAAREAQEPSEAEVTLVFFSPLLLSVGAALRLSKVTGEIRIEREAERL